MKLISKKIEEEEEDDEEEEEEGTQALKSRLHNQISNTLSTFN